MQNRQFLSLLIIATTSVCAGLTACSHSNKPAVPTFVTYDSRQLNAINAGSTSNANTFADIKGRLESVKETPFAGTDVLISDTAVNTGPPATGIKVMLKGNAFEAGIFGAPKKAIVSTSNADGNPGPSKEFTLTQDDSGMWKGDVDLKCEKEIMVGVYVPARLGGEADVQLSIAPKDKGGASSAIYTHSYTVRSETEEPQN
jgi:hypothetical protein